MTEKARWTVIMIFAVAMAYVAKEGFTAVCETVADVLPKKK